MVDRILGVYNADGGLGGELRYIIGHLLGTVHCALCDITHSPFRRKREWDDLVAELGVVVDLRHLNELDEREQAAVGGNAPVVLIECDGMFETLLDAEQLELLDSSVAEFGAAVRAAMLERCVPTTPAP
jgi:alkylhydroperoxidase family enzyme